MADELRIDQVSVPSTLLGTDYLFGYRPESGGDAAFEARFTLNAIRDWIGTSAFGGFASLSGSDFAGQVTVLGSRVLTEVAHPAHTNRDQIDKVGADSNDMPTWKGLPWPGGGGGSSGGFTGTIGELVMTDTLDGEVCALRMLGQQIQFFEVRPGAQALGSIVMRDSYDNVDIIVRLHDRQLSLVGLGSGGSMTGFQMLDLQGNIVRTVRLYNRAFICEGPANYDGGLSGVVTEIVMTDSLDGQIVAIRLLDRQFQDYELRPGAQSLNTIVMRDWADSAAVVVRLHDRQLVASGLSTDGTVPYQSIQMVDVHENVTRTVKLFNRSLIFE